MKAQFIELNDVLYILFFNGQYKALSLMEARAFVETLDVINNYPESKVELFAIDANARIQGDILATINDDYTILFHSIDFLRDILNIKLKYISVAEYAEKHGKGTTIVRRLCQNNRIPGVIKKGKQYLIPEDAPYPIDARLDKTK